MFKNKNKQMFDSKSYENPIRDEIFSPERFEQYAKYLASELKINTQKKRGRSLLPRIKQNSEILKTAYQKLTTSIKEDHEISPSGEWIIDNFHIIEDQIREIKEDLPEKYYLELPKIKSGELKGFPRVYAIALTLVAHSDSHIEIGTIKRFIESYQTVSPLLIGELWAIPIALRIALIENLRRLATQIIINQGFKEKIDQLSDSLMEESGKENPNTNEILDDLSQILGQSHFCDCSAISHLSQRFHVRTPEILPACERIDEYLAHKNLNIEEIVKIEHQFQVTHQVSVSNAILSMRLLSTTNWKEYFESLALVEPILAQDPLGAYKKMDFSSRDRYRHAIERIHKKTGHGEIEISQEAVRMAQMCQNSGEKDKRKHHVGYYLTRKGVRALEKKIGYCPTLAEKIKRLILDHPTFFYLGFLASFITLLFIPVIIYLKAVTTNYYWAPFIILIALIPASDTCLNILNLLVTYLVGPFILPKFNFKEGIPDDAKTFVIVPTILRAAKEVPGLLEDLEIRYLGNQDPNLYFAILSDFADGESEVEDKDQEIISSLQSGIEHLNQKYLKEKASFYLFHRKRLWNPKEKKWMGWERKRGKIHEFNRFLRGDKTTSFTTHPPYSQSFSDIKYVITLDTDTKLPRYSAKKLVGTIAHPLNAPQFDKKSRMVKKGYSILQPRISITPESSSKSIFSKVYSGHTGVDPYSTAVSDVYQDLFGEGIYTGKGLYVVDTFEASLEKRVPENTLLSHDLFEGIFARAALVTDVEFLDDYPSHFRSYAMRNHRWIRGDWQIIKWMFSHIYEENKAPSLTPLSFISRWKIFDNLRRSLVTPMTLLWFVLSWTIIPGHYFVWTLLILTVLALPIYFHTANRLLKVPQDLSLSENLKGILREFKISSAQLTISILTLPYQSYLHLDAIVRTLYRVFISKNNLLKWTTAAQVESTLKGGKTFILNLFKYSTSIVSVIFLLVLVTNPSSLFASGIFLIAWVGSPWVLDWLSKNRFQKTYTLTPSDRDLFRDISFRTWNFFETFVTEGDNWLPPDNVQVDPEHLVAHRTSPTNMGLYLLSVCSAYNLGHITKKELIGRLEKTLQTMEKLEKNHGHFLNWYDTESLTPLVPEYISTVDSGNLAGNLLALKQFCLELVDRPKTLRSQVLGLVDIIMATKKAIEEVDPTLLEPTAPHSMTTLIGDCLILSNKAYHSSQENNKIIFNRLNGTLNLLQDAARKITLEHGDIHLKEVSHWLNKAFDKIKALQNELDLRGDKSISLNLEKRAVKLASTCHRLFIDMDFSFLYDKRRKLFTIGYNVQNAKADDSFYDLLASEARLTSFIAIAKGDVPESHWFHLGRQMTFLFHHRVLISWSASMFEYLMPLLIMKNYFSSLLSETYISVVKQQISYGHQKKKPWGMSESAYNARDLQMNYQYGPFGVPGMGLKRGLSNDYVISPYSTALAAQVLPEESLKNFKQLIANNLLTSYGFYEAVDYTEGRLPPKQNFSVIKNFMAHHQGMTLVAMDNLLNNGILPEMFHQDPIVKSTELLLQERIPPRIPILQTRPEELLHQKMEQKKTKSNLKHIKSVNTDIPQLRVLSNGNYTVMLTATGTGFSRCGNLDAFRWREDPTLDSYGQFIFLKDQENEMLWSPTFQPLGKNVENYQTTFSDHKVEYWCNNKKIRTHMEVIVSPEDDVEIRHLTISNLSDQRRTLDILSYSEPVLSTHDSDVAHPAFNKLFINTEYVAKKSAILGHRRKRSESDDDLYAIHLMTSDKSKIGPIQYETDRLKFLGRGNSIRKSKALKEGNPLSNTVGSVIDPIFSLKTNMTLAPFESIRISFVSGLARSKAEALRIIDQYHDIHSFSREDKMAWTQSQITIKHLNISLDEAHTFQDLACPIIFSFPNMRPRPSSIKGIQKAQNSLWSYGISGDLPILFLTVGDQKNISFIKDILIAHEFLKSKNISFDLVILSDESSSYRMALHDELLNQIRMSGAQGLLNKRGGIFLLRKDLIPEDDQSLIYSVARVSLDPRHGSLKKQVERLLKPKAQHKENILIAAPTREWKTTPLDVPSLEFFNGFGGFKDGGREYVIFLKEKMVTPAPWVNVIANQQGFGFLVSESGSSYTWSQNSRENRITPWSNDPVSDPSGEICYLKDRANDIVWSPTSGNARDSWPYMIRHGQGYSIFEHNSYEIKQSLTMYNSPSEEMKFVRLKLKNLSNHKREISAYYYLEWVLGLHRGQSSHHIVTESDLGRNLFFGQNHFNLDFGRRISYSLSNKQLSSFTCHRPSFIGANGDYDNPIGLRQLELDNAVGSELDPCLAMKVDFELEPDGEDEVIFILGQVSERQEVINFIDQHSISEVADKAFIDTKKFWDNTLETIQIKTPSPEIDILMNRWVLYQNLSCRIWARSAFYQSGGAYGFRDQLQDMMALLHSQPQICRQHILKAAAHQFPEGDVLHWWHPPIDRGVRTRFSDDLLWLPYVVFTYIEFTGDESILNELVSFIEGPQLSPGQDDFYMETSISENKVNLYQHCLLALDRSLNLGEHGLPLMGSGDWNDGMNLVGNEGQGESVWLAWFLGSNLINFINICEKRGDIKKADTYRSHLEKLKGAVETTGWDGDWYRRAYFDNGSPLGSKENEECKIDSIAQSWSVLSEMGNQEHRKKALISAKTKLVDEKTKIIHLFTPPFDKAEPNPGYIKGYIPGVRENGGQYNHAAIWLAMAFAKEGESSEAVELLKMINPNQRSLNKEDSLIFMTEPYVLTADIYSTSSHAGKGGWSWYTGSSCWFYRAYLESILGIYRKGSTITLNPSLPDYFDKYEVHYRFGSSHYHINVKKNGKRALFVDDTYMGNELILNLNDDQRDHSVRVELE